MTEFQESPAIPPDGVAIQRGGAASDTRTHQAMPPGGVTAQPPSKVTAIQSPPHTFEPVQAPTQPITKRQEVCRVAAEIFGKTPDWVTFFREVLGVDGVARRIFSNEVEMEMFEQTEEYAELQVMVAKLRERSRYQYESNEPTRVITVRLPKSLHESLKAESHQRRTSMNQLCISKLLQIIDNDLVPSD